MNIHLDVNPGIVFVIAMGASVILFIAIRLLLNMLYATTLSGWPLFKQYIENNLSETELKRRARSPTLKNINTVRRRLLGIISEGFQHVGQAAYVRGLLKGAGWFRQIKDEPLDV